MPKMQTTKSASKRFRVTRKGKIMYVHSGLRHNLEHMSAKQKRAIFLRLAISNRHIDPRNQRACKRYAEVINSKIVTHSANNLTIDIKNGRSWVFKQRFRTITNLTHLSDQFTHVTSTRTRRSLVGHRR